MATSALIPTFEALRASGQQVVASQARQRLYWKAFGSFPQCIQVADDSGRRPYQTGPDAFDSVAHSALTDPPVSSITVTQADLNNWEEEWVEAHYPDGDTDQAVWVYVNPGAMEREEDGDGEDGEGRKLVRCCGEDRPRAPPPLIVGASTMPFVTVHNYVVAVHSWLRSQHDNILRARSVHMSERTPSDALEVDPSTLEEIGILDNNTPKFIWKDGKLQREGSERLAGINYFDILAVQDPEALESIRSYQALKEMGHTFPTVPEGSQ